MYVYFSGMSNTRPLVGYEFNNTFTECSIEHALISNAINALVVDSN